MTSDKSEGQYIEILPRMSFITILYFKTISEVAMVATYLQQDSPAFWRLLPWGCTGSRTHKAGLEAKSFTK